MKTFPFVIAFAALLSLAAVAAADPLPSYVAFPPGYSAGRTEYRRYDRQEMSIPSGQGNASTPIAPAGHWWTVQVAGDEHALTFPLWRTALEHAGWTVLVADGRFIARHAAPGGPAFFITTGWGRFTLVEPTAAPAITLAPPGPAPETVAAGHDFPFFTPLPGMTQSRFQVLDQPEEMTGPATDGPFLAGPPVTRIDYRGPAEISGLEVQVAYSAALAAAGWAINYSNLAGITVAHYTQHARDIWLKVHGGNGELHVAIADMGAAASAARLRAAIDHDGHVAIYGIYFDVDRDTLRGDSEATLQQILALLRTSASLRLEVQGHTDNTGSAPHNQTLSEARANSVRAWLVAHGIAASRLTAAGYGATRPVADNASAQGRARNRRVELQRLP